MPVRQAIRNALKTAAKQGLSGRAELGVELEAKTPVVGKYNEIIPEEGPQQFDWIKNAFNKNMVEAAPDRIRQTPYWLKSERILSLEPIPLEGGGSGKGHIKVLKKPVTGNKMLSVLQKNGISDDELYWTGLAQFLQRHGNAKITTDDALRFLDENMPQITQTMNGLAHRGAEKGMIDLSTVVDTERAARIADIDEQIATLSQQYDGLTDSLKVAQEQRVQFAQMGDADVTTKPGALDMFGEQIAPQIPPDAPVRNLEGIGNRRSEIQNQIDVLNAQKQNIQSGYPSPDPARIDRGYPGDDTRDPGRVYRDYKAGRFMINPKSDQSASNVGAYSERATEMERPTVDGGTKEVQGAHQSWWPNKDYMFHERYTYRKDSLSGETFSVGEEFQDDINILAYDYEGVTSPGGKQQLLDLQTRYENEPFNVDEWRVFDPEKEENSLLKQYLKELDSGFINPGPENVYRSPFIQHEPTGAIAQIPVATGRDLPDVGDPTRQSALDASFDQWKGQVSNLSDPSVANSYQRRIAAFLQRRRDKYDRRPSPSITTARPETLGSLRHDAPPAKAKKGGIKPGAQYVKGVLEQAALDESEFAMLMPGHAINRQWTTGQGTNNAGMPIDNPFTGVLWPEEGGASIRDVTGISAREKIKDVWRNGAYDPRTKIQEVPDPNGGPTVQYQLLDPDGNPVPGEVYVTRERANRALFERQKTASLESLDDLTMESAGIGSAPAGSYRVKFGTFYNDRDFSVTIYDDQGRTVDDFYMKTEPGSGKTVGDYFRKRRDQHPGTGVSRLDDDTINRLEQAVPQEIKDALEIRYSAEPFEHQPTVVRHHLRMPDGQLMMRTEGVAEPRPFRWNNEERANQFLRRGETPTGEPIPPGTTIERVEEPSGDIQTRYRIVDPDGNPIDAVNSEAGFPSDTRALDRALEVLQTRPYEINRDIPRDIEVHPDPNARAEWEARADAFRNSDEFNTTRQAMYERFFGRPEWNEEKGMFEGGQQSYTGGLYDQKFLPQAAKYLQELENEMGVPRGTLQIEWRPYNEGGYQLEYPMIRMTPELRNHILQKGQPFFAKVPPGLGIEGLAGGGALMGMVGGEDAEASPMASMMNTQMGISETSAEGLNPMMRGALEGLDDVAYEMRNKGRGFFRSGALDKDEIEEIRQMTVPPNPMAPTSGLPLGEVMDYGDIMLTLGSGMGNMAVAGLEGIGALMPGGRSPTQAFNNRMENPIFSWNPGSFSGVGKLQAMSEAMEPVDEFTRDTPVAYTDYARQQNAPLNESMMKGMSPEQRERLLRAQQQADVLAQTYMNLGLNMVP